MSEGEGEAMFLCARLLAQARHELDVSFPSRVFAREAADAERQADGNGTDAGSRIGARRSDSFEGLSPGTSSHFQAPDLQSEFSVLSKGQDRRDSSSSEEPQTPVTVRQKSAVQTSVFRLAHFFSLGDSPTKTKAGASVPVVTRLAGKGPGSCYWHIGTLEWDRTFRVATRVALDPYRAETIAVGTLSGAILVWKFPEVGSVRLAAEQILLTHNQGISALLWVSGGEYLVSASIDETLAVWRPSQSSRPVHECRVQSSVASMVLHPHIASIVITAAVDGSVRFFSLPKLKQLMETVRYGDPLTCLSVSPDGCTLAAGSSFGILVLYSLQSLRLDAEIDCRNRRGATSNGRNIVGLDWSRDSQFICVSSLDSRVRVVHLTDLSRRTKFKADTHSRYVNENLFNAACFSNKERRVIAVSESGNICAWDVHLAIDTNSVCTTCQIPGRQDLGSPGTATHVQPQITASHIVKRLSTTLARELNLPSTEYTLVITADTNHNISILVELL